MGSREDAIKKMNEAIVREVRMNEDPLSRICMQTGARFPLHVLDLFSGLHGWTKAFRERGDIVRSVELNPKLSATLHADIATLTIDDLLDLFPDRRIDIILASPPCTTFSVASIGTHWGKWPDGSPYRPKTPICDTMVNLVKHTVKLIEGINPPFFWVENPRGVLRKLDIIPKNWDHAVIWYCKYGDSRAKPTDLWGKWPKTWTPHPPCKNGASIRGECHHEAAPRGAKTGTQGFKTNAERSVIPYELSKSVREVFG